MRIIPEALVHHTFLIAYYKSWKRTLAFAGALLLCILTAFLYDSEYYSTSAITGMLAVAAFVLSFRMHRKIHERARREAAIDWVASSAIIIITILALPAYGALFSQWARGVMEVHSWIPYLLLAAILVVCFAGIASQLGWFKPEELEHIAGKTFQRRTAIAAAHREQIQKVSYVAIEAAKSVSGSAAGIVDVAKAAATGTSEAALSATKGLSGSAAGIAVSAKTGVAGIVDAAKAAATGTSEVTLSATKRLSGGAAGIVDMTKAGLAGVPHRLSFWRSKSRAG